MSSRWCSCRGSIARSNRARGSPRSMPRASHCVSTRSSVAGCRSGSRSGSPRQANVSSKAVKDAMAGGKPLPMALREARVWGAKERLFERVAPLLSEHGVAHLVEAAQVCDGLVKGLKHPEWPIDPWDGLKRLVLMVCEQVAATMRKPAAPGLKLALMA